jgi:TolB-like protein
MKDGKTAGRQDGKCSWANRAAIIVLSLAVIPSCRLAAWQCPDGAPPPCRGARTAAAAAIATNSVAVLYFDNLSRDSANAYLADGLTEELIVRLGNVRRIEVKSRFESQRVRGGAARDPRALGRSMRAAYLVTGSLQQAGQRVRLSVSLVRTSSGAQVWGNVYNRSGTDVLEIQSDIATEVAGAITGQLLPAEQATLARRPTNDPVAYDFYLRGINAVSGFSETGLRAGLELLDRAIAHDSAFAEAYAQQALIWSFIADGYVEGRVGYTKVREAASRALRLDPSLAVAWSMLSWSALALDYDGPEAVRLARKALDADPRNPLASAALGTALAQTGDVAQGLAALRRGWMADTLSTGSATAYLWLLEFAKQADSLAAVLPRMRSTLGHEDQRAFDGLVHLMRGDAAGAAERFTWQWFGGWFAGERVQALVALGRRNEALATRDSMLAEAGHGYYNAYPIAKAYAALGDADSAFAWLGRANAQRTMWIISLPFDDAFAAMRTDPRFAALLRRIGR